jgi:hypothetical protein
MRLPAQAPRRRGLVRDRHLALADLYDPRYAVYRDLYAATRLLISRLAIT